MYSSRFGRELLIRGGITLVISAITYFLLDAGPGVWLIPLVVVGLVIAKWTFGGQESSEERDGETPRADSH